MTRERRTVFSLPRVAVAWGVSLFLILAGATASQAYWTTTPTTVTSTATAGSVDASQAGFNNISATLTKSSLARTTQVTLTNGASLDADWSYALASTSNAVAGTTFTVWPRPTGQTSCTNSTAVSGGVSATGSTPAALTGHFAPNATIVLCARLALSSSAQVTYGGQYIDVTGALTASVGNWTGGSPVTARVAIKDDSAPTAPALTLDRKSGYSTRLTWTAATDNVGVAGYKVYRGTTLMATLGSSARTWTDASLAANTTYSFQVEAYDAAGNATKSSAASVTTLNLVSNGRYDIYAAYDNRCLDVARVEGTIGTELHIWDCYGANNQLFILRPVGDGTYQLEPQHATSTAVGTTDDTYGRWLTLMDKTSARTHWVIEPNGSNWQFKNDVSGLYIDIEGAWSGNGTKVTQWGYHGGQNQVFQLRAK